MSDKRPKNNPHDTKRVPVIRDGSASGADEDEYASFGMTRKIASKTQNGAKTYHDPTVRNRKPLRKKAKTHYAVFLVTTVFVGVVAAVFVFAMMFNELSAEGTDETPYHNQSQTQTDSPQMIAATPPPLAPTPTPVSDTSIGLVQAVNVTAGRIDLYMLEDSQMRSFQALPDSVLRDKFGNPIIFADFRAGDVVEITYEDSSEDITRMRISAQVDNSNRNIRGVVAEPENGTILIGNTLYSLSPHAVVMYHGTPDSIENIHAVDVVSVDIFQNRVVFVDIHQGSGTIHIPENDLIINGIVEVGNIIFTALEGDMDIRVPEGLQRVVIRGTNIEPLARELHIDRDGTATVDFDGLTLMAGMLTVYVDDPNVVLTVNGEARLANAAIMLEYGTHTVVVSRDGFYTFEQEITINAPSHDLTVVLNAVSTSQDIVIETTPPGARIYINGHFAGLSPVFAHLDFGSYLVTIVLEGFVGGSAELLVTGERSVFSVILVADPNFQP